MGRVCVSSCRWCVGVPVVHPVAILSAVFCVIYSLLIFVSNVSGDNMVETYSSMGLIMALYVAMIVLDQCDEPLSLFVLSVCAYGGVVGYFRCFSFLCEFCFLYPSYSPTSHKSTQLPTIQQRSPF